MPHSTELPSGVIETGINYMPALAPGEPERVYKPRTMGYKRHRFDTHIEKVTDMRGNEEEYKIDTHGFQLVKANPVPEAAWTDDAEMKSKVYPDVVELLKKTTGASHVHIFSNVVRRDPYQAVLDLPKDTPDDDECKLSNPAMIAHIDQSYRGAEQVLEDIPEAPQLLPKSTTRWGIINVWKPLKPVTREPLAVCDARSVPEEDLQQIWLSVNRPKNGVDSQITVGLWYLQRGEGHKWYWPKEMQPDEALLIKCFDTKMDGTARRAPHSAMQTPGDHGPTRESVEFRTLCFWEDQEKE